MAVKPGDLKHCTPNDMRIADQMEKEIDEHMREKFTHQGGTWQIREGATPGAILEIQRRYGSAGWTVKHDSDQREGSWLTFRPTPPASHGTWGRD